MIIKKFIDWMFSTKYNYNVKIKRLPKDNCFFYLSYFVANILNFFLNLIIIIFNFRIIKAYWYLLIFILSYFIVKYYFKKFKLIEISNREKISKSEIILIDVIIFISAILCFGSVIYVSANAPR